MKALIQRVSHASVQINNSTVGQIDDGILAYIGIGHNDNEQIAKKMVDKIITYRIFENAEGKLDNSLQQRGGGLLLVSQFTLMAKTDKGRRPDFSAAMSPQAANVIFDQLIKYATDSCNTSSNLATITVASGVFGANMQVTANNDGPLNFLIEINN